MSHAAASPPASDIARHSVDKRRVALQSMLAATAMTILKLVAGLVSGSLGVLSDAAHSGLDLAGAALTFFSVSVSDKPADEDHTYGHGKFENLSSFGEAALMIVSCAWIIWEAMQRIVHDRVELHHSAWPIAVILLSIAVDFWRSRELRKVAERTGSPALATDAFHFASDIWASLAVLAGFILSWLGMTFHVMWMRFADPFAAVVVSLMILRITVRLTRETVSVLMDEIPAETRRRILHEVQQVDGVLAIEQARVRRSGPSYFADLTLAFPRRYTFEHTSELVRSATEAVHKVLPTADVVIHTVPRQARAESIFDRVRAVAARHNISVHELSIQSIQGKLRVEQHVELDETLPLLAAHDFVTALEAEILSETPELDSILTHIESEPATIEPPVESYTEQLRITNAMRDAAAHYTDIVDVHEIIVGRAGDHVVVSCHCTLPDQLVMSRVHELITALEDRFKLACPEVYRVTIHPEPVTDNLR
ncbi:MAG: cation diffusion facilitator family transporter [Terracidiphilus sp.]|nr:cation diffusion facilitator family transporter [Terracidiphilus sp.]